MSNKRDALITILFALVGNGLISVANDVAALGHRVHVHVGIGGAFAGGLRQTRAAVGGMRVSRGRLCGRSAGAWARNLFEIVHRGVKA